MFFFYLGQSICPAMTLRGAHLHVVGMLRLLLFYINHLSWPTPFHSLLVSISVFMALSLVFHSISSPDNSPLSHFVLPVLFLPY